MTLALQADLAQLLAEVLLEPDSDLRDDLVALSVRLDLPSLSGPLARMVANPLQAADLPVEYARLFLHAKDTDTVHLFESVQARGHHMAPEVLAPLKAIYDEADISVQEDLGIPPDHLGLELACLSYLLAQVLEGDLTERPRYLALAQRLLRAHLRPLVAAVRAQLPLVQAHPYFLATLELASGLLEETEKELAQI